jgi:enoyl-CoA hydratase
MEYTTIAVEKAGRVALVTFDRPERLNAINVEMKRDLIRALDDIEADAQVGAIVIAGAGRAFGSGADLEQDAAGATSGVAQWRAVLADDLEMLMRFWDCPKPTIAAVHGYCLALACELAMACDITIAEEGALLGEPELKFGSSITAMLMPWIVGPKLAKELLLTGDDRISAERAERIGLVNRVVAKGTCREVALAMARRIAALDADGVRLTKEAINRSFDVMGLREALRANLDLAVQIESLETPARAEFKRITRKKGLKAALAWRERRLR